MPAPRDSIVLAAQRFLGPLASLPMSDQLSKEEEKHLARAVELAQEARDGGNHPFGALLVRDDGTVLEARNGVVTTPDVTAHAELSAIRDASRSGWTFEQFKSATLYTSTEPCAMCSGALYWAGVRRVVFALSEAGLYVHTGTDHEHVLRMPAEQVFAAGKADTVVRGPFLDEAANKVHAGFWQ